MQARIDKYALFNKGVFIEQMTPPHRLAGLIQKLRPVRTKFELTRIGSKNDGGYLVPMDTDGVVACFSPGVSDNASFEEDLYEKTGIRSHLADYSVDGPPKYFAPNSFLKKFIGAYENDEFTTLNAWVRSQSEFYSSGDFILQMDIEGGEYASILAVSDDVLERFRIIVIEIHQIESWGEKSFFGIVEAFFEKLLQRFHVVHNHANNCCGLVNLGGIISPRVFELTLLRKDRSSMLGFVDRLPHPLDAPNLLNIPEILVPEFWYKFGS